MIYGQHNHGNFGALLALVLRSAGPKGGGGQKGHMAPEAPTRHTLAPQNIGIKHGFPCINVCQVPREMLKTEAEGRGFQQLPRDLANVNALENNV